MAASRSRCALARFGTLGFLPAPALLPPRIFLKLFQRTKPHLRLLAPSLKSATALSVLLIEFRRIAANSRSRFSNRGIGPAIAARQTCPIRSGRLPRFIATPSVYYERSHFSFSQAYPPSLSRLAPVPSLVPRPCGPVQIGACRASPSPAKLASACSDESYAEASTDRSNLVQGTAAGLFSHCARFTNAGTLVTDPSATQLSCGSQFTAEPTPFFSSPLVSRINPG